MRAVAGIIRGSAAVAVLVASTAATPGQTAKGDAKRGAEIAAQGTKGGAPACVACHDVAGNPDGSGTFPRLFGLPQFYLVKQLDDYTDGRRTNDIMVPVAQLMSLDEIADVANYYANASKPRPTFPPGDPALVAAGRKLAVEGSADKAIPACDNCHGPGGAGEPPAIPWLAGQFGPYISAQLRDWRGKIRKNDGGQQMGALVGRLDDRDIAAVAEYYQQVATATSATTAPTTK
jgi:cytochrome c553